MRAERLSEFVTEMTDLGEQNGVTVRVFPSQLEQNEDVHYITVESQPPLAPALVLNALHRLKILRDTNQSPAGRSLQLGLELSMPGSSTTPGSLTFRDHNAQ
ncbi:MAG TPA: hypothetical protein VFI74_04310 [Candidatus Saccharimonadales bacterium]|nr:hypothetical protein [Candidatus Saccharimonadales bacterium]